MAHSVKIKQWRKKYYQKNRESIIRKNKEYRSLHPEKWRQYQKKWRSKNRRRILDWHREYYEKNRETINSQSRRWRNEFKKKYPQESRRRALKYKLKYLYGMPIEEYDRVVRLQKGRCGICRSKFKTDGKNPHVDHCKIGGHVRGILCSNCNLAIGLFRHSLDILNRAIAYLNSESIWQLDKKWKI